MAASLHVAQVAERGTHYARRLRKWLQAYINNRSLPENLYGSWSESFLDTHEDLHQELMTYLQSVGKYFTTGCIVQYMQMPEVKLRWKLEVGISEVTAKRWMEKLGYRWT